jgi:type VI secretion system secreted protein VgrG
MFIQAERLLTINTALGEDALLMTALAGQEAISQLFHFQLDLASETPLAFEDLLGQDATISLNLPDGEKRRFHGIISRLSSGLRDETFLYYRAELVPKVWLLTRNVQSRIFQHESVPDILKSVFKGFDVAFELVGTFYPREFCVQYRESDFAFASRLMEEEGIYYFFKYSDGRHQMVLANTPQSHPDLDPAAILLDEGLGGTRDEDRILNWEKTQELRSGKYTLWDHCFELPHQHLDAEKTILEKVQVGSVQHHLLCGNEKLEIYDFPGRYAQRYDGVDKGGGEQPSELDKIFEDNQRLAEVRMQQEALPGLMIQGTSNCRHFVPGSKFRLEVGQSEEGQYVLTSVFHAVRQQVSMRGEGGEFFYENRFHCIPIALPFRPQRVTPLPRIYGSQTAVVVGPPDEEIFTDKYGRVKVQFHWDRQGKNDADSSCWIRVSQPWAGKSWGSVAIPRLGQEVIVDFIEGDPDRPIITGRVYNADQMPPYTLPENKTQTGSKSRSSKDGDAANFNEIRFEDKKGTEEVYIHAEKDENIVVENDCTESIGRDRHLHVKRDQKDKVERNKHNAVVGFHKSHVKGDQHLKVTGNRLAQVEKNCDIQIDGSCSEKITGKLSLQIENDRHEKVANVYSVEAQEFHLSGAMKVIVESGTQISLVVGGNFIDISSAGIAIQGTMVLLNSGGAPGARTPPTPANPVAPDLPEDPIV